MNVNTLRNYNEWLKRSPAEIIEAVKRVGGWRVVFPDKLPLWAHRVRNFFNLEPMFLTRQDEHNTDLLLGHILRNFDWSSEEILKRLALSGHVYRDFNNRVWFQMTPGAAIYHYGSDPSLPTAEAIGVTLKGQSFTPVFKLFSRDLTGGSCETIIENPKRNLSGAEWLVAGVTATLMRDYNIGSVDIPENVSGRIVKDQWHRGSYNYAETIEVGKDAHEKYDVEPHKKNKFVGVYINPPNTLLPLHSRRFPSHDPQGKPLANQI